jgi:hypothetical protein
MRKFCAQLSFFDTCADVFSAMAEDKPAFLRLLEEHIDFRSLIPPGFYPAFHLRFGRPRKYQLESFIRFFILQKILGVPADSLMLNILNLSRGLQEFCGFSTKVPDASKITRFRQDFVGHLKTMFDRLVEMTEPICREIHAQKADYLIYDTTGIEAYVAENNPKFLNAKLNQAKKAAKKNPNLNPHALAYSFLPDTSKTNPSVKQQYINGHFCYAFKTGILTNGLGVVRDVAFFDESFKRKHPEVVSPKTDHPALDKEIGDSVSLKPVLSDFFGAHPTFSYATFLGDAAFDSYDTYRMLRNEFSFARMAIPLNKRNSSRNHAHYDENGTPVCPLDQTPFTFLGPCRGGNRSERFKYVCHKSVPVQGSTKRICTYETPCTDSPYGRCVYTYPGKDLRLYPGIPRATEHWDNLYRHRVLVERTINILKDPLAVASRKSYLQHTAKADLLFAAMTQLVGVILANTIQKPHLYQSLRKLIAA